SRDIGVRFTPKTWNLTTHQIDPNVDEARDYVLDDLLASRRVAQWDSSTEYSPHLQMRPATT
ncbi:LssY C-terminal domain-containing protein, partial [Candidatus Binatus sp.]|uniref:LssY C-terminal domain-containing protein n=1 Tax=Candidatus Binatus sp. TaxID=2811406 RepID=UPI003CC56F0A